MEVQVLLSRAITFIKQLLNIMNLHIMVYFLFFFSGTVKINIT